MKKIIALLVIALGVSFSASAQQKKAVKPAAATQQTASSLSEKAKADVAAVDKLASLSAQDKQSLQGLFEYKHREIQNLGANASEERKTAIAQVIDAKLRATLTPEKITKLEAKPEVLKQVTH